MVLGPIGQRSLLEFLSPELPCIDRSGLTKVTAKSLSDAEEEIFETLSNGQQEPTDLVVFPLDGEWESYARRYTINVVPTLTKIYSYLVVVSMDF